MDKINIGIVGMGGIGNNHARCYQNNPHADVVAVCDIDKERAQTAAEEYGATAFSSVQEMLAGGIRLDAAGVTTAGTENGSHHYEPTLELLGAGIPVLGEKPISNDVGHAGEMVALAREKSIPYAINLNHRFTPAALRAKEWIDTGRLGELHMIRMMMWISNPNESSPHFHMRALHPHSIDVMRYFCGNVVKVHAFFRKGFARKIWSNVQVNMLFENGVIGNLMGSYDGGGPGHSWGLECCEVIGHGARFVLEDACEVLHYQPRHTGEDETYRNLGGMKSFGETFQSRIDRWIEDLRNGVAPERVEASGADALQAQLVIEAAIASWENNSVESISV
jgi:predicted dehydrogenase